MHTKLFMTKAKPTTEVVIQISEDGESIDIIRDTKNIGRIELTLKRDDDDRINHSYYYIVRLSLEQLKRQGIGRASLEFHKEIFKSHIVAASNIGIKLTDGSHLTGDGVPFIQKMRNEGIVCSDTTESVDDYYLQAPD